jgi:hypothetical protein
LKHFEKAGLQEFAVMGVGPEWVEARLPVEQAGTRAHGYTASSLPSLFGAHFDATALLKILASWVL